MRRTSPLACSGASEAPVGDAVGKSIPRLESREKVSGNALYTDDITRLGMLHAVILGSPYPHAKIISCDTSAAESLDGVFSVITAKDLPNTRCGMFVQDQPLLARDKVLYVGDPVAAVAAVDSDTAKAAALLIAVEYEELESVFDAEKAMKPDAPILHENKKSYVSRVAQAPEANVICYTHLMEGDPDAAWSDCDVIVEDVYELPAQYHMYMETCSTIAECDANGKVTIWSSTQGISRLQVLTAKALELPMTKVRVKQVRIGGAFGGKSELAYQPIAVALTLKTGKPVKLTFSREEDMTMMKSRHGGKIYMKTGAKRDGTLVARTAKMIFDGGAYADQTPEVAPYAALMSRGPYRITHHKVEAWGVYTNKLRASAFRGFGNPQATFASESQIDEIAQKLEMDPIDLRLKNLLKNGDEWFAGKGIECASATECLEKVRRASNWNKRRRSRGQSTGCGKRRGLGVSVVAHISAFLGSAALVRLNEDGTFMLCTGASDLGQGSDTILTQIAAATLGVSIDRVNHAQADSDHSPYNFATSGSRTTFVVGNAVMHAAERLKEKIIEHASTILKTAVDQIEIRAGGFVGVKGAPEARLSFAEIAEWGLYVSGGPLSGSYEWLYQPQHMDPTRMVLEGCIELPDACGIFTFGAHVAEVEVDEVTGKVEVVEYWAAHDVGKAINPKAVEGQIQGGIVQGMGYALTEEMLWEEGQLVNPTMMDYKILGMSDVPYAIHPIIVEVPLESAPFGAKGVAENCINGPAPTITSAIKNAVDVRMSRIPATPERILRAMLNKAASPSE